MTNKNVATKRPEKICGVCKTIMKFHPGCCGNQPFWRCEKCGRVDRWKDREPDIGQYILLK